MTFTNFTLFPRFPSEIRREIWLSALDFDTPRAYAFYVDYEIDYEAPTEPPRHILQLVAAQLVPGRAVGSEAYYLDESWEQRWPDLIVSTQVVRALLATCHESRAAALDHSPDKLPFSTVCLRDLKRSEGSSSPYTVSEDDDESDSDKPPTPERPAEPTRYWLPFSGERDIIIVGIPNIESERMFANWVARGGGAPLLQAVRNLAVYAGDSSRGRYRVGVHVPTQVIPPWKPPHPPCSCGLSECLFCTEDPLLELLTTCCPRLKTLSFAILDRLSEPLGRCISHVPFEFELVPACACSSGTTHRWPMVQLMDRFLEWCVWYPEAQTECPFPTLPSLEEIRKSWHPNWPYYESLRDVEVRVLRCVEVEKGKDKFVSGWRTPEEIISRT
jgi:hypothetical protein